jgi:hypothetical protein
LCDGSFALFDGQPVIVHPRQLATFEWRKQDGKDQIFSSDQTAVESIVPETVQSCEPMFSR